MSNSIIVKEDARRKIERIGETFVNFQGAEFTIVEYINATKVTVEFKNGYRRKTSYKECLGGSVKNPYIPIIYGVGYIGEGKYKAKRSGTGRKPYETW